MKEILLELSREVKTEVMFLKSSKLLEIAKSSVLIKDTSFSKPVASESEKNSLEYLHKMVIEKKLTEPEIIQSLDSLPIKNVSHDLIRIEQDQMNEVITSLNLF